ncbi:hypothetical protein S23_00420 [Bradyrhizobium cosmicum]|uniref:Uncharacterized protein n=1 Tax=Bradyrhizobium cosmicum TaxID=1404864 RepID=A0AAI8Q9I0_9BRAD|nr:hypothetical protein S23_00420 [Bradyrhizobium cosmicum]
MRDEIDQEIVEQLDEIGTEPCGIVEEQIRDGARDFAATPGITAFDDIVQSGNERRGNGHETQLEQGTPRVRPRSKPPHNQGI